MRVAVCSIPLILISLFFGCALSKRDEYPGMYKEKPISITVLPITNNTTAADSSNLYLSTLAEPLSNMGYYVFPIEITNEIFVREGISSGKQLENIPATRYRELFGTDTVLSISINKWNTSYLVLAGNVSVELECKITSTKTGEILWSKSGEISIPIQENSGNPLIDVIMIAVKTAAVDYVPVARRLNEKIFNRLPAGKYSNHYELNENRH